MQTWHTIVRPGQNQSLISHTKLLMDYQEPTAKLRTSDQECWEVEIWDAGGWTVVLSGTMKTNEGLKLMKGPTPGQWQSQTWLEAGAEWEQSCRKRTLWCLGDVKLNTNQQWTRRSMRNKEQGWTVSLTGIRTPNQCLSYTSLLFCFRKKVDNCHWRTIWKIYTEASILKVIFISVKWILLGN